jgi:hypothetical protein
MLLACRSRFAPAPDDYSSVRGTAGRTAGAAANRTDCPSVARLEPHSTRCHATVTPDIAFQNCSNAAAAAWYHRPPYVTYHVATHVSVPSLKRERDILRYVAARTDDDTAVVQDLPKGRSQITHAFPLLPTFDAISYFVLTGSANLRNSLEAYVHDVKPLEYQASSDTPQEGKQPDVVVVRLRAYRVKYAPDSSESPDGRTHLTLEPYQFVTQNASKDNFFFDDLVCDNATNLPTHVSFSGPDGLQFVVDYTTVDGQWVVSRAHYEQTQFAPLRIGRAHAIIDATFDQFTFPRTAPDPRLAS